MYHYKKAFTLIQYAVCDDFKPLLGSVEAFLKGVFEKD